jgi:hypothetical protein
VLPTVAGTPQAKEAVIEASIPRTATVPLMRCDDDPPGIWRPAPLDGALGA